VGIAAQSKRERKRVGKAKTEPRDKPKSGNIGGKKATAKKRTVGPLINQEHQESWKGGIVSEKNSKASKAAKTRKQRGELIGASRA